MYEPIPKDLRLYWRENVVQQHIIKEMCTVSRVFSLFCLTSVYLPPDKRKRERSRVKWMKEISDAVVEKELGQWLDRKESQMGIGRRWMTLGMSMSVCVFVYTPLRFPTEIVFCIPFFTFPPMHKKSLKKIDISLRFRWRTIQ
jgi:hypothetical protein